MIKRLKEGQLYQFLVEKMITDPSSVDYFVLKGPDRKKYLLPIATYSNYGISVGTIIKCRVDKINCRGQIFLEPLNPGYSEGKSYDFKVVDHDIRFDHSGNEVNVFIVRDLFNNLIFVPCETLPERGASVTLVVERISKGRLYLFPYSKVGSESSLLTGGLYKFLVESIVKGVDDNEYFLISDEHGVKYSISKTCYEYYGFGPGDTIKGKVVKYKRNGQKIIEPVNPYYTEGSIIKLKVTGHSINSVNDSFTLELTDKFGFTHCIDSDILPDSQSVRCRVKLIRKGKPLLILM